MRERERERESERERRRETNNTSRDEYKSKREREWMKAARDRRLGFILIIIIILVFFSFCFSLSRSRCCYCCCCCCFCTWENSTPSDDPSEFKNSVLTKIQELEICVFWIRQKPFCDFRFSVLCHSNATHHLHSDIVIICTAILFHFFISTFFP